MRPDGPPSDDPGMERRVRDVLAELPVAYAVALRLHEAGAPPQAIAAALDVEPEAVPALLDIAWAKARALLPDEERPKRPEHGGRS
jgi:DNA-directed RNA polymerase specialized sigma24 family protein